jgi:hypothetical protein
MNHHRLNDPRIQSRFLEFNLLIAGFTVEFTKIRKVMRMWDDVLAA